MHIPGCGPPGCQKNGAFHTGIQKNWAIHILFVEKRGAIIYLAVLKKGAIRHAHPYYALYRKLPHPHEGGGGGVVLVNSYLSQLVPIFGQLVPVFWSTRTSQVNSYLVWSTRTYFGQLVPLTKRASGRTE